MALEQLNGYAPETSNVRAVLTTPRIFRGWVKIITVVSGDETYDLVVIVRGRQYITTINKGRPHYDWIEHHLVRGWELVGARVLIAATLRDNVQCGPGLFKLSLWRVSSKENAYHSTSNPVEWSFPEMPIEYHTSF